MTRPLPDAPDLDGWGDANPRIDDYRARLVLAEARSIERARTARRNAAWAADVRAAAEAIVAGERATRLAALDDTAIHDLTALRDARIGDWRAQADAQIHRDEAGAWTTTPVRREGRRAA